MGILNNILGLGGVAQSIGGAIKGTSEVFHVNETAQMHAQEARFQSALTQYSGEFVAQRTWFDSLINGLNRLPRPAMALGTIGLFIYAMKDPSGFSERMMGLALIPEPLWWLLGAIVGFYFGARELHHFRMNPIQTIAIPQKEVLASYVPQENVEIATSSVFNKAAITKSSTIANVDLSKIAKTAKTKDNPAILEWLQKQA